MKKKLLFTSAFLLAGLLTFAACAGPAGPEGPQGPPGSPGAQGPTGSGSEMMTVPGEYAHGIVVTLDGENYYFDGPADGMNGAKDIPGHYWLQQDTTNLLGLHYNSGPAMAAKWWSSDAEDGALLYTVGAVIDTWTADKAEKYASMGYVHYHELVRVSDGAKHPNKIVWLRHQAVTDFTLDGGPAPDLGHNVMKGLDSKFINNYTAAYDEMMAAEYEIKITNLTRGQIMSPAIIISHRKMMDPLFTLGSPASLALTKVAEDAVADDLIAMFEANSMVSEVVTLTGMAGPIMPGETATATIKASSYISLVSMLVTTNDALFALNGVAGPDDGIIVYLSPAYDAGSEANNEDGAYIPGPPFGNAGVRATAGAEGYVHVHAGVHGIADLVPEMHDWENPVAKIEIRLK
jgi:hypothetical protein